MSNGVVMGLATYASGPIYAAYGGRTYLLMAAMGVASVLFFIVLLAVRTFIEEGALRAGLRGYDDYAVKVRYRLIPMVW